MSLKIFGNCKSETDKFQNLAKLEKLSFNFIYYREILLNPIKIPLIML
jgi:hypothetical protein